MPSKGMHSSWEVWAGTSSPAPTDRSTVAARGAPAHKCDKCAFYRVNSGLKALIFVPHQDRVLVNFLAATWHFSPNKAIFALCKLNNVLPEAGANLSSRDGPAHTVVLLCFPLVFQCRQGTTVCLTFPFWLKNVLMVSDSCQHVLFLAWTLAVTQLSMKYWWYRIHSWRPKWIRCVLVQLLWNPEMELQQGSGYCWIWLCAFWCVILSFL